jgi:hypothetical protein
MTFKAAMMLVFPVVVTIAAVATWLGAIRVRNALAADTDRLIGRRTAHPSEGAVGKPPLAELPPSVARYLRLALAGRKEIDEVRITQTGTLRTDTTSNRWMRFEAEHLVVPRATGFLWDARVQIAPLLHLRVRDSLIDGTGSGQVSLLSAFTVSAAAGGVEMNSGSLHRYLAEAVWYPTALLPGPHLRWTPLGATSALATLTNDAVSVSLEFRFADTGEVTGIYTPGRWGTFAGGYKQVPWEGHFRDYVERDGVLVPTHGEVGWYIDKEWRAVWKGAVADYRIRP